MSVLRAIPSSEVSAPFIRDAMPMDQGVNSFVSVQSHIKPEWLAYPILTRFPMQPPMPTDPQALTQNRTLLGLTPFVVNLSFNDQELLDIHRNHALLRSQLRRLEAKAQLKRFMDWQMDPSREGSALNKTRERIEAGKTEALKNTEDFQKLQQDAILHQFLQRREIVEGIRAYGRNQQNYRRELISGHQGDDSVQKELAQNESKERKSA